MPFKIYGGGRRIVVLTYTVDMNGGAKAIATFVCPPLAKSVMPYASEECDWPVVDGIEAFVGAR